MSMKERFEEFKEASENGTLLVDKLKDRALDDNDPDPASLVDALVVMQILTNYNNLVTDYLALSKLLSQMDVVIDGNKD